MAALTLVLTYNPEDGTKSSKTTSLTVNGTAYGSLTATQIRLALDTMDKASKMLLNGGGTLNATEFHKFAAGGK